MATQIKLNGVRAQGLYTTISNSCLEYVEGKSMRLSGGYVQIYAEGKLHRLHRYLWEKENGSIDQGKVLHHINNDKRDNRLENLEMTTHAHNMAAVNKKGAKSSKFKGVHWDRKASKWRAKIRTHIGFFDKEIDAALAYDKAYVAIHRSVNGSNEILTEDMVDEILKNPEAFIPKSKQHKDDTMKFIFEHTKVGFVVLFRQSDFKRYKYFVTLEKAKEYRDQCLVEWKELQEKKDAEFRSKPILRDENGVAIIPVKIYRSENIVYAKVDDEDYYDLAKLSWFLNKDGYPATSTTMHILLNKDEDRQDKHIDHINHDKLDNRRSNLRIVTPSQNARNKRKRDGCSSEYMGVTLRGKRWEGNIKLDGKQINLGSFEVEEDAAMAYEFVRQTIDLIM